MSKLTFSTSLLFRTKDREGDPFLDPKNGSKSAFFFPVGTPSRTRFPGRKRRQKTTPKNDFLGRFFIDFWVATFSKFPFFSLFLKLNFYCKKKSAQLYFFFYLFLFGSNESATQERDNKMKKRSPLQKSWFYAKKNRLSWFFFLSLSFLVVAGLLQRRSGIIK